MKHWLAAVVGLGLGMAQASYTYTIRQGDTMFSLAQRHGLTEAAVRQANGLSNSNLRLGQNLRIPAVAGRELAAAVASSWPLEVRLVVRRESSARVWLYSPEMASGQGDQGVVQQTQAWLEDAQGRKLLSRSYQNGSHRWSEFWVGRLGAGEYRLRVTAKGNGRNALRVWLQSPDPSATELVLAPGQRLLATPNTLERPAQAASANVAVWVGKSQAVSMRWPNGQVQTLKADGQGWARTPLNQSGRYAILNPQGHAPVQTSAWMRVNGSALQVQNPGPLQVAVVNSQGQPLKLPYSVQNQLVQLANLPAGYRLLRTEAKGGVVSGTQTQFGFMGGSVRYVVQTPPPSVQTAAAAPTPAAKITPPPTQPAAVAPPAQPAVRPATSAPPIPPVASAPSAPAAVIAPPAPQAAPAPQTAATPPSPQATPNPTPASAPSTPAATPSQPASSQAAKGQVRLRAFLVTPGQQEPLELVVQLGEQRLAVLGSTQVELPEGEYPLQVPLVVARIEAPSSIRVQAGQTAEANIRVFPQVDFSLEPAQIQLLVGQEATLRLRATTSYQDILPVELKLDLPPGLEALSPTGLVAPLRQGLPAEITVRVRATARGNYNLLASAQPWNLTRQISAQVTQAATFALEYQAAAPQAALGSQAVFRGKVTNRGDLAGQVRLQVPLPEGLSGTPLDLNLSLAPGQSHEFSFSGQVQTSAKDRISSQAILGSAPPVVAQVQVQRARPVLQRTLSFAVGLPGETLSVGLRVSNQGDAPLSYTLRDELPEWLEVTEAPRFSGTLAPGQSQLHTYSAKIAFGSEITNQQKAVLEWAGGAVESVQDIKRANINLTARLEPSSLTEGQEGVLRYTVTNPTDHTVMLTVRHVPTNGLVLADLPPAMGLQPGESKEVVLRVKANRSGALRVQLAPLIGETLVAIPGDVPVVVRPVIVAQRSSTLRLSFEALARGDRLLLGQKLPPGVFYLPGTVRVNGALIAEPRQNGEWLLFEFPYEQRGLLSFTVQYADSLPALEQAALTLRIGDREFKLLGNLTYDQYSKGQPVVGQTPQGLIKNPAQGDILQTGSTSIIIEGPLGDYTVTVNDEPVPSSALGKAEYNGDAGRQRLEFFGIELLEGRNVIVVQMAGLREQVEVFFPGAPRNLAIRPLRLVADGRTPLEFEVLVTDVDGLPTGFGGLTIESNLEPLDPDALGRDPGYQVFLRDGRALLRLKPIAFVAEIRFKAKLGSLEWERSVVPAASTVSVQSLQGSVVLRLSDPPELFGFARAYLEYPLWGGAFQGVISVSGSASGLQGDELNNETSNDRFPLIGASEASRGLTSSDGIAFRYDRAEFGIGYYNTTLTLPGLTGLPRADVLRFETRGAFSATGFAGLFAGGSEIQEIVPDGTRLYRLERSPRLGSERVWVREGADETALEPGKDYTLDALGFLALSKTYYPTDLYGREVRIIVQYSPLEAPRQTLGYGIGLRYAEGGYFASASFANLPDNQRLGVEVGYRVTGLAWRLTYQAAESRRFGFDFSYRQGAWQGDGSLALDLEGRLSGRARVGVEVLRGVTLALEQQNARSQVLGEARLDRVVLGVGSSYDWSKDEAAALARIGYRSDDTQINLTQSIPFSVGNLSTRLSARYLFSTDLSLDAEFNYDWLEGLTEGSIGLKQKLGVLDVSVGYQLPSANGNGNRARFTINAPLALDERWSIDARAGYERSLSTGQDASSFGVGVKYQTKDLNGFIASEVAFTDETKLTLRAGATGNLDAQQTLSLDATFQLLPTPEGRFTLSYAYRGPNDTLLTYHRYTSTERPSLDGELAYVLALKWYNTQNPDPQTAGQIPAAQRPEAEYATEDYIGIWQLRPVFAYRVFPTDGLGNTYQLGVAVSLYGKEGFGVGGGVYRIWQPGSESAQTIWSIEGSVRIIEGFWLSLGYASGAGLTLRDGLYLRLDAVGGSR